MTNFDHLKGKLPDDAKERKKLPVVTGVLDYFPDALAEVAAVSFLGNEQHNPGEPLHWAIEKSTDHPDCLGRHLIGRGTRDTDGGRHSAKLAWRALASLQLEIMAERETDPKRKALLMQWTGIPAHNLPPAKEEPPPKEDWITHDGRGQPIGIGLNDRVTVKFRNGEIGTGTTKASYWDTFWDHSRTGGFPHNDIVEYRKL